MTAAAPRRILVMGLPGSGKSTLARRLGARHGLPVFHLDQFFWCPGWKQAPPERFLADVERLAARPAWVMDGNYTRTAAPRLRAADTLIILQVPAWLSVWRILRRILAGYGRVRADAAPGCPERLDLGFLRFAWTWNRRHAAAMRALASGFPGRTIVLRGRGAMPEL